MTWTLKKKKVLTWNVGAAQNVYLFIVWLSTSFLASFMTWLSCSCGEKIQKCFAVDLWTFFPLYPQVTITARDNDPNPKTAPNTATVTVNVYRNQFSPTFINEQSYSKTVNQDTGLSSLLTTVTATDRDEVVWRSSHQCFSLRDKCNWVTF